MVFFGRWILLDGFPKDTIKKRFFSDLDFLDFWTWTVMDLRTLFFSVDKVLVSGHWTVQGQRKKEVD